MKRVIRHVHSLWLKARIAAKWHRDCHALPLTPAHRELYDIIHRVFWHELVDFPELLNCRDFNDRIQWLKLFDQNHETVRCSDKYLVRDYIRENVGEEHLVDLYQVHNNFSEIDFESLPKAFVIKANHDSGSVILVRDKSKFNCKAAKDLLDGAIRRPYGWTKGEWAYSYVQPRILVEEFINPEVQRQQPDYKFYVVEGAARFCHYIYDRGVDTKEQTIDRDGRDLGIPLYTTFKLGNAFVKPKLWPEMLNIAEAIGRGFKCVRVDLYQTGSRVIAGEMTFWPMAGLYKGEGQKTLGRLLDFDRATFKPIIIPELENNRSRHSIFPNIICRE